MVTMGLGFYGYDGYEVMLVRMVLGELLRSFGRCGCRIVVRMVIGDMVGR